jgi:hypothetical protein
MLIIFIKPNPVITKSGIKSSNIKALFSIPSIFSRPSNLKWRNFVNVRSPINPFKKL